MTTNQIRVAELAEQIRSNQVNEAIKQGQLQISREELEMNKGLNSSKEARSWASMFAENLFWRPLENAISAASAAGNVMKGVSSL